jgi:hypothetical protein
MTLGHRACQIASLGRRSYRRVDISFVYIERISNRGLSLYVR